MMTMPQAIPKPQIKNQREMKKGSRWWVRVPCDDERMVMSGDYSE